MADNVIVVDIPVKARVHSVDKASVVVYLIDKERRCVFDKLGGVILVNKIDLAPSVVGIIAYKVIGVLSALLR